MSQQSGGSARPTKSERKEQARLEREALQAKMARSKRTRWIVIGAIVVVVAIVAVIVVTRPQPVKADTAQLLADSASQAKAAGCSDAKDVGPYQPQDLDRTHIGADGGPAEMPALSTYPSVPPASGPHSASTQGAGVYSSPPSMDQVIHSLEHGAAIVWYSPDASGEELTKLLDFYRGSDVGSRVIVAPYDYPDEGDAGQLPVGTDMALVAWHHVETCSQVNLAAAFGFTARYAAPPFEGEDYLGTAPEAGVAF